MKKATFEDGGFVLHKIAPRGNGGGKISAWFAPNGELLESEYVDTLGRSRKCGKADIANCEMLGRVHKATPCILHGWTHGRLDGFAHADSDGFKVTSTCGKVAIRVAPRIAKHKIDSAIERGETPEFYYE